MNYLVSYVSRKMSFLSRFFDDESPSFQRPSTPESIDERIEAEIFNEFSSKNQRRTIIYRCASASV